MSFLPVYLIVVWLFEVQPGQGELGGAGGEKREEAGQQQQHPLALAHFARLSLIYQVLS